MQDNWSDFGEIERLIDGYIVLFAEDGGSPYTGSFVEIANNFDLQDELLKRFPSYEIEDAIERRAWSAEQAFLVLNDAVGGPLAQDQRIELHQIFSTIQRLLVDLKKHAENVGQQLVIAEARLTSSKPLLPVNVDRPFTDLLGFAVSPPLTLEISGDRVRYYASDLSDDEQARIAAVQSVGLDALLSETRRISALLVRAIDLTLRCESSPVCLTDLFVRDFFAAVRVLLGASNKRYNQLSRQLTITDAELRARARGLA